MAISIQEVLKQLDGSLTTFRRAISDFRRYLMEHHPKYELVYDREGNRHLLQSVVHPNRRNRCFLLDLCVPARGRIAPGNIRSFL